LTAAPWAPPRATYSSTRTAAAAWLGASTPLQEEQLQLRDGEAGRRRHVVFLVHASSVLERRRGRGLEREVEVGEHDDVPIRSNQHVLGLEVAVHVAGDAFTVTTHT
jgi:hypothetical protein